MSKNKKQLFSGVTWVVVADSSHADIYQRRGHHGALEPLQSLSQPAARAKESDLVADGPGRAFDSAGRGRHAMEPVHSEKDHLRTEFAHSINKVLESGRTADAYQHLIFVAAPEMLGELRAQLSKAAARLVHAEFAKDLTAASAEDIVSLIDGA